MDPAHPFPFISNLSLNLLVTLHHPDDQQPMLARVKVPVGSGVPRFLRVGERHRFVRLEDVMAHNLDRAVPGHGGRQSASSSGSRATPTPSATRRRPTTCWR